jgi:hypothetical protein
VILMDLQVRIDRLIWHLILTAIRCL